MKKWDIYVIGDINIDQFVPGVDKLPPMGTEQMVDAMPAFVGGGAALFALGTAKLGMKTVFQGRIGRDFYGTFIRDTLRKTGGDDRLLQDTDEPTGITLSFTGREDRCFITFPGANAGMNLEVMNLEEAARARHVHLTGYQSDQNHEEYKQALTRLRTLKDVTISMDIGWDPTGLWSERIFELLPMLDIMLMNEEECLHYTRCDTAEDGAERIGRLSKTAVVKLGRRGSLAWRDGKAEAAAPFPVRAVDPTGAGDSFNAGFITGFLLGKPLQTCLRMGNACGAMSVTALGGNTAFPAKAELEELLHEWLG